MARRRSCYSCGQTQHGSGAFCSSCGKPVDAPELELVSLGFEPAVGNDVVLPRATSTRRTAVIVAAAVAALVAVGVSAGRGTSSAVSSASSPTVSTTTTESPSTTIVASPVGIGVPVTLTSPVLPGERTGVSLLLLGLPNPDGGNSPDSIVNIDAGTITPLGSQSGQQGSSTLLGPNGRGLVVIVPGAASFEIWDRDGTHRSVPSEPTSLGSSEWFVGTNRAWTLDFPQAADGQTQTRLVSLDFATGARTGWATALNGLSLLGIDEQERPVVAGLDGSSYAFDLSTRGFVRVASAPLLSVVGVNRLLTTCDEHLVCGIDFQVAGGTTRRLGFDRVGQSRVTLSPDGAHAVRTSFGGATMSYEVADTATGDVVHLGDAAPNGYGGLVTHAWSSDGRWLFLVTDAGLSAWRSGLAKPVALNLGERMTQPLVIGVFPS